MATHGLVDGSTGYIGQLADKAGQCPGRGTGGLDHRQVTDTMEYPDIGMGRMGAEVIHAAGRGDHITVAPLHLQGDPRLAQITGWRQGIRHHVGKDMAQALGAPEQVRLPTLLNMR